MLHHYANESQAEILAFLRMIVWEQSLTAVLTMHDINQAIRFTDRFLFLKDSEIFAAGKREIITPELIEVVYGIPVTIAEVNGMPFIVPGTAGSSTGTHLTFLTPGYSKDLERVRLFHQFRAGLGRGYALFLGCQSTSV